MAPHDLHGKASLSSSKVVALESKVTVARSQLSGLYTEMVKEKPNYPAVLSSYRYLFHQLESMSAATEAAMQLQVPEPTKPTEHVQEVPFVLSTMVTPEDTALIGGRDESMANTHEGLVLIETHNENVEKAVEIFTELVDEKKGARTSETTSEKSRRIREESARKRRAGDFLRQHG